MQLNVGDIFEDGIIYEINKNDIKIISKVQKLVSSDNKGNIKLWELPSINDLEKWFIKDTYIKINKTYHSFNSPGINKHWIYLIKDINVNGDALIYYGDFNIIKISDLNLPENNPTFPTFYVRTIKIN